jgi:hypothetical protein
MSNKPNLTVGVRPVRLGVVGAVLTLLAVPHVAYADPSRTQCIDSNTKAQDARRDLKFSVARDSLRTCSASSCPGTVRDDCIKRLDDLEKAQPTIVFDAKDASGRDVIDVKVTVDGAPLAESLVGAPLAVDPGRHTFTFAVPGRAAVSETFAIKEGEKDRHERIPMDRSAPDSAPPVAPAHETPAPPAITPAEHPTSQEEAHGKGGDENGTKASAGGGPWKTLGVVTGAVGVAGLGVGAAFGLLASSAWNTAQRDCPGNTLATCPNHAGAVSEHSTTMTDATISTAGFIAGGVLVAGGVALFIAGAKPSEPSQNLAGRLVVMPVVGPSLAGVSVGGGF